MGSDFDDVIDDGERQLRAENSQLKAELTQLEQILRKILESGKDDAGDIDLYTAAEWFKRKEGA
jgi:hypothetical protein